MAGIVTWCRVKVLDAQGNEIAMRTLSGSGDPTVAELDRVALLALWSKRLGGAVVLSEVVPELLELLELAGLCVEVER